MLTLALQTMRGRLHGFVGGFAALTLAVTIVTAFGVLLESGARAHGPVERYAGVPVVVVAEQHVPVILAGERQSVRLPERPRIPVALARRIATIDGVREVIADHSLPATVATTGGRLLAGPGGGAVRAQGWRSAALTPYRMTEGHAPRAAGEVVLDSTLAALGRVAVGDHVRISFSDRVEISAVVGLARPARGRGPQGAVFVSDAEAARLSVDRRRVEALGVLVHQAAGAEAVAGRIQRSIGESIAVYHGDDRGRAESRTAARQNEELVALGGAFGGFAVMLAVFVVAATLGLSVLQRGRELALLRAVGAKPRQIRRLLVGEALIVGLGAGLAGVVPGVLLASALFGPLQRRGIGAETASLVVGPLPPVVAITVGAITAALAAWLAGRRAARIRPTAALAEAAIEPKQIGWLRLLLGLVFLAGGATLSVAALSLHGEPAGAASFGVVMILMVAVALLGPLLALIAAVAFGPGVAAFSPTSGFLAMANVRTHARRFASASTPVALGVAISVALIGTVTVEASATEKQSRERVLADRVLTAPQGLPAALLDDVRRLPGVIAATAIMPTHVGAIFPELGGSTFEYVSAVAIAPRGIDETLELEVRDGSLAELPLDGVAVSTDRARALGVDIGDNLALWLADGRRIRTRVVATYGSTLGFGELVLPHALVRQHVESPMHSHLFVRFATGAGTAATDARLSALASATPGVEVLDRTGYNAAEEERAKTDADVGYFMIGMLIAFVTVAAVNGLVMAIGERAPELVLLRLVGATPKQVSHMVRWEALAVIGFGVLIGLAVATASMVPFSLAIAETAIPHVPWQAVAGVVAGALLLGFGASELPMRYALRRDPVDVIGARE